jgi:transcriptional regulator with XRE-family HTH domain
MAQTRLKQLRDQAVLTVHELAEASGVSDDTISKIENGQRVARPNTLRKLAHALNVSPQELRRPAKTEELAGAGKDEAPREAGPILNPEAPANPFDVAYALAQQEAKVSEQAWTRAMEAPGIPQAKPVGWLDHLAERMAELFPDPEYRYSRLLNGFLYGAHRVLRLEGENARLREENARLRQDIAELRSEAERETTR